MWKKGIRGEKLEAEEREEEDGYDEQVPQFSVL
jgi:hypothetical protein